MRNGGVDGFDQKNVHFFDEIGHSKKGSVRYSEDKVVAWLADREKK
jgi:hypothetical protein